MKHSDLLKQFRLLSGFLAALILLFATSVSAEPVLRIVSFTAAGPDQQEELDKLGPAQLYAAAKGRQWIKFWSNPFTDEVGPVSL
jgi:hypothetical protein